MYTYHISSRYHSLLKTLHQFLCRVTTWLGHDAFRQRRSHHGHKTHGLRIPGHIGDHRSQWQLMGFTRPGKLTFFYRKSPLSMGKSTINGHVQ